MSDYADIVRDAIWRSPGWLHAGSLDALDALVAERDEAQRLYELFRERYESKYTEWNASKTNAVKAAALGKWAVAIISNVSEGDLTQQAQEWQDAAHKWLDEFHAPARAALAEDA